MIIKPYPYLDIIYFQLQGGLRLFIMFIIIVKLTLIRWPAWTTDIRHFVTIVHKV